VGVRDRHCRGGRRYRNCRRIRKGIRFDEVEEGGSMYVIREFNLNTNVEYKYIEFNVMKYLSIN
jgi:hypothetical protein